MSIRTYLICTSALGLLAAAPAFAQDDETTDVDAIVSVGTRDIEGVNVDRIGGSLTVISADDFEARQVRQVSDVLRDVPGAAISRTGAPGGLTALRMRGAEGNHTMMMIDGIEANDPYQGEFDFSGLFADDMAKLEVLRGQQSALYGSDAIAGVVSYSTLSGRQAQGLSGRAEAGSFGTFGASARLGGVNGDLDYAFNASGQTSEGYPTQTDGHGKRDVGSTTYTASSKVNYRASDALRFSGVVRVNRTDADTNSSGAGGLVVDTPGAGYESQAIYWLARGDYQAFDGRWSNSLTVQGANAWRDSINSVGGHPGVRDGRTEGTRVKYSFVSTFHFEGMVQQDLTAAVDFKHETFDQPINPFGSPTLGRKVDNTGYVADYSARFGMGTGVGASYRHDNNDLFQDADTYRVQAYHRINDNFRVRAAAGTGIKNPTQFELYGFGFGFQGNPDLKAEESKGWEAGADFNVGQKGQIGFTYFDSRLENEIFSFFGGTRPAACPAPVAPASNTACNRETDSTEKGVELFANTELGNGFSLDASYTALNAKENKVEEVRRAPIIASANLGWRGMDDKLSLNLNVRYNGKQQDSNFSSLTPNSSHDDPPFTVLPSPPNPFGRVELPAFTLVNVSGEWALTDKVQLFGRVENLMDEDYYEVITFRTPGRAAYVGLRAKY